LPSSHPFPSMRWLRMRIAVVALSSNGNAERPTADNWGLRHQWV
jgi:hypothetical protein